ncbi:MAG: DinB family protein [Planctomycetaceae bacterium]|nr:DinB family protein [Planctomycetaceae bacterium]
MNAREAIRLNIDMAQFCCNAYLEDLTDEELMQRPTPGCNHINWQIGHLVTADHDMVDAVAPGAMPALPDGFAARYAKETADSDDASAFCTKAELQAAAKTQLQAALTALDSMTDEALSAAAPERFREYAPTVGAVFSLLGSHWMMHSGQWVVVRRQLGRPAMF